MQPNQNKLKVTKLVIITNNDFLIVIFPKVWLVWKYLGIKIQQQWNPGYSSMP